MKKIATRLLTVLAICLIVGYAFTAIGGITRRGKKRSKKKETKTSKKVSRTQKPAKFHPKSGKYGTGRYNNGKRHDGELLASNKNASTKKDDWCGWVKIDCSMLDPAAKFKTLVLHYYVEAIDKPDPLKFQARTSDPQKSKGDPSTTGKCLYGFWFKVPGTGWQKRSVLIQPGIIDINKVMTKRDYVTLLFIGC